MAQMSLSMKLKQIHTHREQIVVDGVNEGWTRSQGLANANRYIGWINSKFLLYGTGSKFNILWWAIMEKNMQKKVYAYMYIWITLQYSRN